MRRAGWAVAAVLGLAHLFRRRGDCQIWAGHAHVHSGLSLARALELCSRSWDTGTGPSLRIVWRLGGRELASVGLAEYEAARTPAPGTSDE